MSNTSNIVKEYQYGAIQKSDLDNDVPTVLIKYNNNVTFYRNFPSSQLLIAAGLVVNFSTNQTLRISDMTRLD